MTLHPASAAHTCPLPPPRPPPPVPQAEGITPQLLLYLEDSELRLLGVTSIGALVKLKYMAKTWGQVD